MIPLWGWAAAAALYFGVAAAAVELAWDRSIDALAEARRAPARSLRREPQERTRPLRDRCPRSSRGRKACATLLSACPIARPRLLPAVNDYLDAVNHEAGSVAVDVIDLHGIGDRREQLESAG